MATNATDRSHRVLNLFEKFYGRVYCFARRSVPADLAEDIAQDVFIRLLEHKNLENMELSVSYLLKVADNLIKRRWQRNQRFGRYQDQVRGEGEPALRSSPTSAHTVMNDEQVTDALSQLPDQERVAVELIVCNELSYEEAAESLGVRVTTVNNWKYRGLQKLKDISKNHDPTTPPQPTGGAGAADRGRCEQTSGATATHPSHGESMLHPHHPAYDRRIRA